MRGLRKCLFAAAAACVFALPAQRILADVTVTVDPGATWNGYMNVFELPSNGGGFVFGSPWGTADLTATFSGSVLTLGPNSVNDPNPFWYIGGGGPGAPGNKIMDANMYVEDSSGALSGTAVTFAGTVLSNTFTSAHSSVAFIKDFAPDFSTFTTTTVALTPGDFSITLNTDPGAGRHVQFGFETIGVNVWVTDRGPFGEALVTAIPEPTTLGAVGLAGMSLLARRRAGRGAQL